MRAALPDTLYPPQVRKQERTHAGTHRANALDGTSGRRTAGAAAGVRRARVEGDGQGHGGGEVQQARVRAEAASVHLADARGGARGGMPEPLRKKGNV